MKKNEEREDSSKKKKINIIHKNINSLNIETAKIRIQKLID